MKHSITHGAIVRSIINQREEYRVISSGHGWIYVTPTTGSYTRFACRRSILRLA